MTNATPSSYIIGIILFMLVVGSGISMIGVFRSYDSTFTDNVNYTDIVTTFNKTEQIQDEIGGLQDDVEGGENDYDQYGVIGSLIENSWSSIRLLGRSFSFMDDVFDGLSIFGVPAWVTSLITLIISVMIIFAIYSLIFQGRT